MDVNGDGFIDHYMFQVDNKDYFKIKKYTSYKIIKKIYFDDIPNYVLQVNSGLI